MDESDKKLREAERVLRRIRLARVGLRLAKDPEKRQQLIEDIGRELDLWFEGDTRGAKDWGELYWVDQFFKRNHSDGGVLVWTSLEELERAIERARAMDCEGVYLIVLDREREEYRRVRQEEDPDYG